MSVLTAVPLTLWLRLEMNRSLLKPAKQLCSEIFFNPDPQTINMAFDAIDVTVGTAVTAFTGGVESIEIGRTSGTLSINGGSIAAPAVAGISAILVDNSTCGVFPCSGALTLNLSNVTATGAADGGSGVDITGESAAVPVTVNLVNTNVTGGSSAGNVGGGAGVRATNAIITLDATSSAIGGASSSGGGGAGIGGIGGDDAANGENFGADVTVTSTGTATGGMSTSGGGGAGIGGGGAGVGATTGGTAVGVVNSAVGTEAGGIGGANNGAAIGAGGDGS